MRALIVGGTGFISGVLARRLWADGLDVTVVARGEATPGIPEDIERLQADRTRPGSLNAALAGRSFDVVFDMIAFGAEAPRQVYEILGKRMGRYVLMSTGAVYAPPVTGPFVEDAPLGAVEPYGAGKLAAERSAAECARSFGVPAIMIRANETLGPRDSTGRRFLYLQQRIAHGLPVIVPGRLETPCNFGYVEDIARLLALAGVQPLHDHVRAYNGGGPAVHTLADVISAMCAAVGRQVPVRELGMSLDQYLTWPERDKLEWHLNCWCVGIMDIRRAREELGWEPRITVAQALARHWDWVQARCPHLVAALPEDATRAERLHAAGHPALVPRRERPTELEEVDLDYGDTLGRPTLAPPAPPVEVDAPPLSPGHIALLVALYGRARGQTTPDPLAVAEVMAASSGQGGAPQQVTDDLLRFGWITHGAEGLALTARGFIGVLREVARVPTPLSASSSADLVARFALLARLHYLNWLVQSQNESELLEPGDDASEGELDHAPGLLPPGLLDQVGSVASLSRYVEGCTNAHAVLRRWRGEIRVGRARLLRERRALEVEAATFAAGVQQAKTRGAEVSSARIHPVRAVQPGGMRTQTWWVSYARVDGWTRVEPALRWMSTLEDLVDGLGATLDASVGPREPTPEPAAACVVPPRPAPPAPAEGPIPVAEGHPAPDFSARGTSGPFTLSGHRGRWVVLFFYPMDETPGCTAESCAFRDDEPAYDASGITLVGISTDSLESHHRFRERYGLPYELVEDTSRHVVELYGVKDPVHGWARRVTFIIRPDGTIARIVEVLDIGHHSTDVLSYIRSEQMR